VASRTVGRKRWSQMRNRARLLALTLALSYLLFFAQNIYSSRSLALRILGQALLVMPLVVWLGRLARGGRGLPRTSLDGALLAWLGVAAIAALTGLSPRYSLDGLWIQVVYVLGFWLILDARGTGWEPLVVPALFLAAGVVCLVAMAEWVSWYLGLSFLPGVVVGWPQLGGWLDPLPPYIYRLNMTLGGATPLSAYVGLMIPPCLAWTLTAKSRQGRFAGGVLLAGLLLVEVLSFSRGGILGLAVSIPILAAAWAKGSASVWRSARMRARRHRGLAIGILLVALVLAAGLGALWMWNSFTGRSYSTRFRLILWDVALETARAWPLTGVGPGNFGRALLARNDGALPRSQIATAHSLYLNTAAEMGLAGLLAGVSLLGVALLAWIRRWRGSESDGERLRVAACGAALAGLAAQQLVDTFYAPAQVLPALVIAAFALVPTRPGGGRRTSHVWSAVALVGVLGLGAWLAWTDVALSHYERSVRLCDTGQFEAAAAEAAVARHLDGHLAVNTIQLAYVEGLWSAAGGGTAVTERATADYQTGLSEDPIWGVNTANLASLLWRNGDRGSALEWMRRTAEADPQALHLLNLGVYYEQMGSTEEAWDSYARTLVQQPSLAGSGFWTAEASRAAAWPEILRRAESRLERALAHEQALFRARVAWAQGDVALAEDEAQKMLSAAAEWADAYVWLARSLLAKGRALEAVEAAEMAVSLQPGRSETYGVLGCARLGAGDAAQAEAELQLALFMPSGAREEAYSCLAELYRARGDRGAAIWAYERAIAPRAVSQDVGMTLYGRAAGFDLLPGLVRIRMGEQEAEPWLRLADLYEQEESWSDARRVYSALLSEDPYLKVAQDRLEALQDTGQQG
jgi:tetratricopeptide (TPR) repeat protein/O-antigen ligase